MLCTRVLLCTFHSTTQVISSGGLHAKTDVAMQIAHCSTDIRKSVLKDYNILTDGTDSKQSNSICDQF